MSEEVCFIAEVSSNHSRDIDRCKSFIRASANIGCSAVKFQLFKIDELFSSEILQKSKQHRDRKDWELPLSFLPELKQCCIENGIEFCCTPFYLDAVSELEPYVDFYKIASYELLWDELIGACARTGKPLVLSTGMANIDEIAHAVDVFRQSGGTDITLLHCVSGYPAPEASCNLAAIETLRERFNCKVGWSDHSRNPEVVRRSIAKWGAPVVEFHLDLDEQGAEYQTGHCWLPEEIEPVIRSPEKLGNISEHDVSDGSGIKLPTEAEIEDRPWRADPSDGLRPLLEVRQQWAQT